MKKAALFLLISILLTFTSHVMAGVTGGMPPKVQAALMSKLLKFYKNMDGNGVVYVVGAPDIAAALKAVAGKGVVKSVQAGSGAPSAKPAVIYCNSAGDLAAVKSYAKSNKVLTVTGEPGLVDKGISLGLGIDGGKPKILLNISSSKEEGVSWNPAILKIASKI